MAIGILKEMSLFGQIRMVMDDFEIQRRDRAAILEYAVEEATRQKQLEIARKMKQSDMPLTQIVEFTGLSPAEVEKL